MDSYRRFRKLLRPVRRAWNGALKRIFGNPREHIERARGIIHVVANVGQARDDYAGAGLPVVWIEPIPEIYRTLVANIAGYPDQTAIQALVTDTDGDERVLHVANNDGQSSSIFDLHQHRDIWPDIGYIRDITVRTETLPTALERSGVRVQDYDALVLDTQGSELLILKGAATLLPSVRYVVTEAAEFEAYKGAATLDEIKDFLREFGFRAAHHRVQVTHPNGGRFYDVIFRRA
jgi:FkbM family methyltransferase